MNPLDQAGIDRAENLVGELLDLLGVDPEGDLLLTVQRGLVTREGPQTVVSLLDTDPATYDDHQHRHGALVVRAESVYDEGQEFVLGEIYNGMVATTRSHDELRGLSVVAGIEAPGRRGKRFAMSAAFLADL